MSTCAANTGRQIANLSGRKKHSSAAVAAFITAVTLVASFDAYAQSSTEQREGAALFDPDDFVALGAGSADEFAGIPVEIASGAHIGTVKLVGLTPDGAPDRVFVALYAGGSLWIDADALRYNPNARILLTNLKHVGLSGR